MRWLLIHRDPRHVALVLEGSTLRLEVFPLGGGPYCLLRWGSFAAEIPVASA